MSGFGGSKIGIFKIDNISSNSSINFSPSIHKGLKADSKGVGGQSVVGNLNISKNLECNVNIDPDLKDQVMKK